MMHDQAIGKICDLTNKAIALDDKAQAHFRRGGFLLAIALSIGVASEFFPDRKTWLFGMSVGFSLPTVIIVTYHDVSARRASRYLQEALQEVLADEHK